MEFRFVDREILRALVDSGRAAFWEQESVAAFFEEFPEERELIAEWENFVRSRQHQPKLLKAFAEWGFGTCLYTLPELAPWAELFALPVPETGETVIEAFSQLDQGSDPGKFGRAAETLVLAQERFVAALEGDDSFPPAPVSETYLQNAYKDGYPGISHEDAIDAIKFGECEPGHGSILALSELAQLLRIENLAPAH